ncbi:MAG TPA: nuclear transport factor 2 family protein [Bryobacteraceae bacterium]|nr:nuclear transport factor 2 family protein [Bryobacteraceae bacterium]
MATTIGVSVLGAQATGTDAGAVAAITKLEQDYVKAALANGAAFKDYTERHLADQFVGGSSFGRWETKADLIKDTVNPANKVKSMTMQDLKVSTHGSTAVARYRLTYDDMHNGEHRARTVLCTDTWSKQGADWKQLASHCSQTK